MELICNYKPSPPPFSSRVEYNRILVDKQPEGERWRRGRREAGEKTLPPSPPDRFFKWSDWAREKGGELQSVAGKGGRETRIPKCNRLVGEGFALSHSAAATALLYGVPSPPLFPDLPRAKNRFSATVVPTDPRTRPRGGGGKILDLAQAAKNLPNGFSLSLDSPQPARFGNERGSR